MKFGPPLDLGVLLQAIGELAELYRGFPWESQVWATSGARRSPYRALILFGLSARTRDRLLVEMCHRFFQEFPDPNSLVAGWRYRGEVVRKIVRAGQLPFLESVVRMIADSGGSVPGEREQLKQIKGVGDKIAECVMAYGWGCEALPLDGNGCRVVSRIYDAASPNLSRDAGYLRGQLKDLYCGHKDWMAGRCADMVDLHELLRLHGQLICTKVPNCPCCPVSQCRFRKQAYAGSAKPIVSPGFWQEWRDLLLESAARTGDSNQTL
ncbi:MAG: hypothetical protein IH962_04930 [Chloroflexi bacterium]|nr:hypothetical protein [Chloroflexota bacterium]